MRRSIAALVVVLCFTLTASAATKPKDLSPRFRTWLTEDVLYIITDEEKKQFLSIDNDQAREDFIESFWEIRNPLRGSKNNPFKEEHYKRIEYANSHFGRQSNTPGWMTDMGRAYIEFGKPTSQHKFVGYGQIYPLDLWFYSNETGATSIPAFFYLLFYIPEDVGEYKFYRPGFDGPLKLVRGSNLNTNQSVYNFLKPLGGDVAHAAFSLIPSDPIDTTNFTTDMGSDILVNKIVNYANDPFNVKRIRELRSLKERVSSSFLVQQNKKLDLCSVVVADPAGRFWLDYGVLIDDPKLGKADRAAKQLHVSLGYRLYTGTGELIAEDAEDRAYAAYDSPDPDGRFQPFVVANRLPVEPGAYRLEVEASNQALSENYKGEQRFTVGPASQLSFSGPLIADSVDAVARPDAITPFQYFGMQFHPAPNRLFDRRRPIRLLFELNQPPGPANDWQIEYVVAHIHDREFRRTLSEDVPASSFKDGRLLKSKTIPIQDLEAGEYRLVVNVRAAGSSEVVISMNMPVRIDDQESELPLFFSALSRRLGNPGVISYVRGLEAMGQRNAAEAVGYFAQTLRETPGNAYAGQFLVQLYYSQRQFAPITEVYKRLGIEPFKASAETLAQISVSFWNTGDHTQAREVLEAAGGYFPNNPLLAQTKSRYLKAQ